MPGGKLFLSAQRQKLNAKYVTTRVGYKYALRITFYMEMMPKMEE
jgi:hypothetical protein